LAYDYRSDENRQKQAKILFRRNARTTEIGRTPMDTARENKEKGNATILWVTRRERPQRISQQTLGVVQRIVKLKRRPGTDLVREGRNRTTVGERKKAVLR